MIFTGPNKENLKKYGKNFPYKAWLPQNVTNANNSNEIYTCTGKPKTVFSGRFCAVAGFVYAIVNGKYSILANQIGRAHV